MSDEGLMIDLAEAFLLGDQKAAELFARMRSQVAQVKELGQTGLRPV